MGSRWRGAGKGEAEEGRGMQTGIHASCMGTISTQGVQTLCTSNMCWSFGASGHWNQGQCGIHRCGLVENAKWEVIFVTILVNLKEKNTGSELHIFDSKYTRRCGESFVAVTRITILYIRSVDRKSESESWLLNSSFAMLYVRKGHWMGKNSTLRTDR